MGSIGARIKLARERIDLTQTDLSRQLKVTSQIVNQWESGNKTPGRDNLFKLIDALKVPPMWLLYGGALPTLDEKGYFVTAYSPRMVPMRPLHSITAGVSSHATDIPRISARYECGDAAFYIDLPDDSNAPRLPIGTTCIFDPDREPKPQLMVLGVYDTPSKPIVGSLRFETSATGVVTVITPLNPAWPAARSDLCEVNVVAVMTESIRRES